MRFIPLLLLASAATAAAQPGAPVFDRTTTFQSCQEITMFACGKMTGSGQRYGTAHTRTECTRYTFHPNGTFSTTGMIRERGRGQYTIRGAKVTLTMISDDPDMKPTSFDLMLSNDGEKLGDMTRRLQ